MKSYLKAIPAILAILLCGCFSKTAMLESSDLVTDKTVIESDPHMGDTTAKAPRFTINRFARRYRNDGQLVRICKKDGCEQFLLVFSSTGNYIDSLRRWSSAYAEGEKLKLLRIDTDLHRGGASDELVAVHIPIRILERGTDYSIKLNGDDGNLIINLPAHYLAGFWSVAKDLSVLSQPETEIAR